MRIVIIANSSRGLYTFRSELIQELLKNNEVVALIPDNGKIEQLKELGCKVIDTPIDRRGINPIKDFILIKLYYHLFVKLKPDLVLTYTIKPNIYGGFIAKKLKIIYAANITGLGTTFQNKGILRKIVVNMYKIALKRVKVVFFENSKNRDILIKEGIINKEKACLLNGAGVNLEHYVVEEYPRGDTIKFLFMGRIMKEKGIEELLASMKKLINDGFNVQLDVLGEYEEDYRNILFSYEKEGWLHYYGYKENVRSFINASHCFVLPSWHEGMANTNLESAASGRPVITSNIAGCKEAVIDGVSGFLSNVKDIDDLYKVMRKFVELSYDERKKMGLEGRKHMETYFDKQKVVKNTIKALMEE